MLSISPTRAALVNLLPPSDRAVPWPTPGEFPVSPREGRPLDLKRTAAETPVAADVALADWSALMNAVKCRLERLVTELPIISQPASESKLRLPQSPQSP